MSNWLIRLLGVLLMLTALAVAMSRAPDRPVETLVARWAPPPSDFIDLQGQLVHVRDQGPREDPVPLLLLHGTAASLHTWEGWVKAIDGRRRVVTFDLPAFGLTGPFAGRYAGDDYHVERYVRFTIDLMDRLKLQRVVIGGNSLGGEIAWRVAAAAPARVERLILVDAAGLPFTPEVLPLGFVAVQLPVISHAAEYLLPRSMVAQSVESVYGDPRRIQPGVVDRYFELALRAGNRRALAQAARQFRIGENDAPIATLKLPTLILWGSRDRLIPPAVGREFQRRIAGSQLVVFEGLGHVPQEEDPATSVAPVKEFLGLR